MISVIIPAYNAEKTIKRTLSALTNQNYRDKYEVIVIDDGSIDDTIKIVSKFKNVKLISIKHSGPATARNVGVKNAKGNIILFTDADCVPSKNWIKNMIVPFKNKEIVGISGTYKTLNKNSLIARFAGYEIETRHEKLKKEKYIDFIGTYSAAYRKNIFLKFGGFDESFQIASGEDPELSFKINKAGLKMFFQPKAFVYHKHPDNILKFLRQKFWRGYWRVFLYKKHAYKIFRHSYTPKSLFVEEALTGVTCLFLFFGLTGLLSLYYGLLSLFVIFLFTLPFSLRVFIKDKTVGFLSPFIIILRNFFTGLGIIWGLLNFNK
jgi:cellulose synthase/poly-beta-1,6-N-acetylglucosamine synthase-like glycosyltransferase